MQLFYSAHASRTDTVIELTDQEAHHISKVLRFSEGGELLVTNGNGSVFRTTIDHISKRSVQLTVTEHHFIEKPSFSGVSLHVGLLKNKDRMEWLVEKATEIGVGSINWLHTDRSESGKVRLDRMEAIAVSAMKQSLQTWLPQVTVSSMDESLGKVSADSSIYIAHELASSEGKQPAISPERTNVDLFIGPEGGFTSEEVQKVVNLGGKSLLLGQNRLRTETAAVTLLLYYHLHGNSDQSSGIKLYELFS
ncbi:MAG: 16S rRNA (uracil(1498)-N(3))-methyltransferase [Balneolales bacterium]|nr:16S rRNA (uracil(1498)-N(3))-methyltransferase [Balneolales bacterium]